MENELRRTRGLCPNCGANIPSYVENKQIYGSPVRTCKKCGKNYIDDRYHEIAVDGIDQREFNVQRGIKISLLGLTIGVAVYAFYWYTTTFRGYYYMSSIFIMIMSAILIIYGIADIISIKTGAKARKMDKLRAESAARLQNKEYAQLLASLGYNVPQEYL